MKRDSPRVLLTLVRGQGRAARSWAVPRWLFGGALASMLPCLFAAGFVGWHLQGLYDVRGSSAQWASQFGEVPHWAGFRNLAPTRQGLTVAQLRRRAALARGLRLGLGSRMTASELLRGKVTSAWEHAAARGATARGTFLWPVEEGWFVRGYGSGEQGYHLAVDIMGERGSPVLAAADGIVGYSGNTVRGFGNLLLLVHPGGFVTAYAHNDRNHVVAGERVRRGQVIADLGNTGISRGPHVHFELMHNGKNCDPLPLFRPGVRHRAGHLGVIKQVTWEPQERRPREVACGRRRRHPNSRYYRQRRSGAPDGPNLATLAP
ncbi:MAG: M23 family metallopeptidase [Myxococcales bacterium]|nr:M23 family metallopeptidase [Myxococcales bacterium]